MALFVRRHKHVALTMLGREYLEEVREPLQRLAAATARIKGSRRVGTVSICVYPTFAIRWLIPRWGRFYDRHPEIDVRLTTSLNPVDFRSGDYDLAIRVGREGGAWQGLVSHKLVDVEVYPVCSPDRLRFPFRRLRFGHSRRPRRRRLARLGVPQTGRCRSLSGMQPG